MYSHLDFGLENDELYLLTTHHLKKNQNQKKIACYRAYTHPTRRSTMPSRSRSVTPRRPRSVPPRRRASTRLKQTADGSPEPREEQAAVLPAAAPPTPLAVSQAVVDFFNWISTFWPYKPLWPLVALFLLMKYEEVNNCAQGFWHSLSYFWHCSVLALLILVFCFTWENVWEKCYQNKTQVMVSEANACSTLAALCTAMWLAMYTE